MPPVSQAQNGAMHAAAQGRSALGIPASVGREFIGGGVPQKRPANKKTHRGRKPSTKPGASHLAALQQAHGAGDFKAAKSHALNYAKAVHQGTQGIASTDDPMDDGEDMNDAPVASVAPAPMPVAKPAAQSGAPNARAMLAKLVMNRRK